MSRSELADTSRTVFLGLLIYMPLHILLSTWIGTSFGILASAKIAKDGIMLVGFLCALGASYSQPWFKQLLKERLIWLILAFAGLNVILALLKPTDSDAETLGLVYNTRFLVFFLYGLLLAKLFDARKLVEQSLKAVLATATFVLFFGIMQYAVLPNDALTNVGYAREHGVLPAFFIDDKPNLERAMSTLRDPNSLGSYIIIIGSIALAVFIKSRMPQQRKVSMWLVVLSVLCLVFTFSRSAWLGFFMSALVMGGLSLKKIKITKPVRRNVLAGLVSLVVLASAGIFAARDTYLIKNVIYHADESTVLENPNELRVRFWQESAERVADQPLGHGPGTAGLTSIRNQVQGTNLNENYYLQMAHELGVLGLVLFLAILGMVGLALFRMASTSTLALGMFASFTGLLLTNFLVHIWANEAVAYTWWGLAGLIVVKQSLSQSQSKPRSKE